MSILVLNTILLISAFNIYIAKSELGSSSSNAETGPINPVPGQYANFTLEWESYTSEVSTYGYYYVSYSQPQGYYPNCINISLHMNFFGLWVFWEIVNTTDRSIVDSYGGIEHSYYPFMIPIDVRIGQTLTWWTTPFANATIIRQEEIYILNKKIDCWVLFVDLKGEFNTLNDTVWFDKSTGHAVIILEYQPGGFWNMTLSATNIPIGNPLIPPEIYTIGMRIRSLIERVLAPLIRLRDLGISISRWISLPWTWI